MTTYKMFGLHLNSVEKMNMEYSAPGYNCCF